MTAIRLHPEATADPLTLRWVTDTTALTGAAPALRALIDEGTLADVAVAPGEIHTRLAPDRSWADDGERVRSILYQSLSDIADGGDAADAPELLYRRVAEVLRRDVAPLVDSHGGSIRIVSLTEQTLTVALDGACGHCTLRSNTLRNLVTTAVRTRLPQIRSVRAVRG